MLFDLKRKVLSIKLYLKKFYTQKMAVKKLTLKNSHKKFYYFLISF